MTKKDKKALIENMKLNIDTLRNSANDVSVSNDENGITVFDINIDEAELMNLFIRKLENVRRVDRIDVYDERAVIMRFTDGTYTKAVCTKEDVFNLETGIMICMLRKMLRDDNENKNFKHTIRNLKKTVIFHNKAYPDTEVDEK